MLRTKVRAPRTIRGKISRRKFFNRAAVATAAVCLPLPAFAGERKAQIAISLDLEMARNFPRWEDTHWDYEKGNLTDETKAYAVEGGAAG